jgi:hypothetical protein
MCDDSQKTEKPKSLPPEAPLMMIDVVLDTFPTYDGLRKFYMDCGHQPLAVLHAVQRRLKWDEYFNGEDASLPPFDKQPEDIVSAFFLTLPEDDADCDALEQEISSLRLEEFGSTRQLPYEFVVAFLRAWADKPGGLSSVHYFLSKQFRPMSWPSPRLGFKQGQAVWVAIYHSTWHRATVMEINPIVSGDDQPPSRAAY